MRFGAFACVLFVLAISTNAYAHKETYPMNAATYMQQSEVRLGRYRERLEKQMNDHSVGAEKREDARRRLAFMELIVRGTIARAAGDGTVTETEADQIRELSKNGRGQIYSNLGLERAKGE